MRPPPPVSCCEVFKEADKLGLVDLGDLFRVEEITAARAADEDSLASRAAES